MTDPATTPPEAPERVDVLEARYRALFDASHDAVYIASHEGRLLDANPAMLELFGYGRGEVSAAKVHDLFAEPGEWRRLRDRLAGEGSVYQAEVRLRRRDGREIPSLLTLVGERAAGGATASAAHQAIIHDLTERQRAEERLDHAVLHDALTQLPNRTLFHDRVKRLLDRATFKPGYVFAVLFVDLDRFKLVNDSMGHRAGDELLMAVAERLSLLVRPEDIVGRLGGDEFGVVLLDIPGAAEAEMLASRIHEGLKEPFDIGGAPLYVSASVGIAVSSDDYTSPEEILRDADTAMYAAKASGGRGWAVFDDAMRDMVVSRVATENALRLAMERDELLVYYQPLISITNRRLQGFEALLRWRHPERGLLLPADFLPVAEETGLIVPIGDWVLSEVCRVAAEWRREMADVPVMAVNVSAQQLHQPGLGARLREILDEHGLPGSALRLEVTESSFLERSPDVHETLRAIDALGIDLCLDDFGTGYSTFAYLRDLPFRTIKIDRSFVTRLSTEAGFGMIETILSLATQLNLATVVEGVETEEQVADLVRLGCENAQGFLFSEPVGREVARELLEGNRSLGESGDAAPEGHEEGGGSRK